MSPPGPSLPRRTRTPEGPALACQDYSPRGPPPRGGSGPSPAQLPPPVAPPGSEGDRKAERGSSSTVPGEEKRDSPPGAEATLRPPTRDHASSPGACSPCTCARVCPYDRPNPRARQNLGDQCCFASFLGPPLNHTQHPSTVHRNKSIKDPRGPQLGARLSTPPHPVNKAQGPVGPGVQSDSGPAWC